MRRRMRVLVIAAHMDDEVLGMGGTLARHVEAGDAVSVCLVSQRAYGHRFTPALVAEEKASALAAATVLGVRDVRFLDLPDERLGERLLDLIVPLEEQALRLKPDLVYTNHRGDNNQDHRAVFDATMVACRAIAKHAVRRVLCYEVASSTEQAPPVPEYAFQPNFYVNITRHLPRKLRAMRAYRRELRPFPHPRSLKGLEVLAAKRGMEIGWPAAEAFVVLRDAWS